MGTIKIENVSFSYDDMSAAPHDGGAALHHIDLQVPDGQFLCLIGHSGSGKSTLIRLLLGLDLPDEGTIAIDGEPVTGPSLKRSFVFQNYSLFPWMTAKRNVEFGIEQANKELARGLSKTRISEIADFNLQRVGMDGAAGKYPYQLSGGMKQRVAIARALAMDAEILFFDEPFGALDVRTRRSLQDLVAELWTSGGRRRTVVFVTHDISEAILLADRVAFMSKGQIVADTMVDLPRPRSMAQLVNDPTAVKLDNLLTDLFYREGDDEDGDTVDQVALKGLQ